MTFLLSGIVYVAVLGVRDAPGELPGEQRQFSQAQAAPASETDAISGKASPRETQGYSVPDTGREP